jgi:threonine synthase
LFVERVEDEAIRRRIRQEHKRTGTIMCPHTAAAAEAWHRIDPALRAERPWLVASTAHPYKFAEVVEPLVEEKLRPPAALSVIEGRAARAVRLAPELGALMSALDPDDAANAANDNMEAA